MKYNSAFFGLFENVFKLLKNEYGKNKALEHFSSLMSTGLKNSYGTKFEKGNPETFKKIVSERDQNVGLRVEFIINSKNEFLYRFLDDPFPNLQGLVDSKDLDHCYMDFKIKYLLGNDWDYETTSHLWSGGQFTEHRIFKKI